MLLTCGPFCTFLPGRESPESNKAIVKTERSLTPASRESPAPTSAGFPPAPLSATTDVFASLIGREIAASYQRQLLVGTPPSSDGSAGTPLPTTALLPNGHHSPAENRVYRKNSSSVSGSERDSPASRTPKLDSLPTPHAGPSLLATTDIPYILDTAHVATKIREILSTNNIGQRLFAKHVLGLSQGTVSELLSKPKHWEKLTEKGRESYRKMHAWACDEKNVNTLKAIAPKKGKSRMFLFNCHQTYYSVAYLLLHQYSHIYY